jgi:hypothetical protein
MVLPSSRSFRHRTALVSSALCALAAGMLGAGTGCNAMRGVNAPTDLLASNSVNRPQAIDMTAANRTAPPQFTQPQLPQQQFPQQQFSQQQFPQPQMAQQPFPQASAAGTTPNMPQIGMAGAGMAGANLANGNLANSNLANSNLANGNMANPMSGGAIAQVSHTAPLPNACQVILKDADGKTTRTTLPLDKQRHIQDLLVQSGALKQFSRMDIALLRTTPSGGKQRMNVEFDRSKRAVEMQYDYFIMPGDVLLVNEDPSTIVDDMIKNSGLVRSSSRRTNR